MYYPPELAFERAWEIYLDRASLFPYPPGRRGTRQIIRSIYDIAEAADVFVFDGAGVLNVMTAPVSGMADFIRFLTDKGKHIFVLTNGASYPSSDSADKLRKLGYNFCAEQIVSSRDVFCDELAGRINNADIRVVQKTDILWGTAATDRSLLHMLPVKTVLLGDAPEDYERAGGFILLSSGQWNDTRCRLMTDSLKKNPRPVFVANPDVTAPLENYFSCEPGYYAYIICSETGISPEYFGKPFANAYDYLICRIGQVVPNLKMKAERVMMVGDTPQTDILGGINAGFQTLLMADYGLLRDQSVYQRLDECGIFPDYILTDR